MYLPNSKSFTFDELKNATVNFNPENMIGEGGFGVVYKGWLDEETLSPVRPGIGITVAVKKLKQNGLQGHKEWLVGLISLLLSKLFFCYHRFYCPEISIYRRKKCWVLNICFYMLILRVCELQSELHHLGQLHHPNLVKLVGYCLDGENRLLVYEYMPKRSLENHLFISNFYLSIIFQFS